MKLKVEFINDQSWSRIPSEEMLKTDKDVSTRWAEYMNDPESILDVEAFPIAIGCLQSTLTYVKNPGRGGFNVRLLEIQRSGIKVPPFGNERYPAEVPRIIVDVPDDQVEAYIKEIQKEGNEKVSKIIV